MAGSNYGKYMVKVPIREAVAGFKTTGRSNPPYTYMSNELVPGCNAYVEISWIWEMPTPKPIDLCHSHNYPAASNSSKFTPLESRKISNGETICKSNFLQYRKYFSGKEVNYHYVRSLKSPLII